MPLPDPALVVLVGPSGSGKSTWAAARYRSAEVVSSDTLRGVVGSGPHDLDASDEAFALLETIVAARLGRGLSTVVDTLGTDAERRLAGWGCARPSAAGGRGRPRHLGRHLPDPKRQRATSRCRPRSSPHSSSGTASRWPAWRVRAGTSSTR